MIASDGVLSSVCDGAAFTVEAKAPSVQIITPEDGLRVLWGTLVNFTAEITDPQQAPILDADIVWSNAYRTLGTGPFISPTDLEVGTNVVTVSVTNAAGFTSQASVTVLVGDDLRLPGPKISATPTTIPFSVAATELNPQAESLSIANAGGGTLSVTIASDAGWLLLDGGPGGVYTAPATIALLVDPTVLPDATVSTASITIQNNADPSDLLIVPVTLAKGAVFTATPFVDDDADEALLAACRNEDDERLAAALATLDVLEQELILRSLAGETTTAIAGALGLTPGNERVRKHRAIKRLQFALRGEP